VSGAEEPVVVGVQVDAFAGGGGGEVLRALEAGVVGDAHIGHGRRAAGDEGDFVFFAEGEEAFDETASGAFE